MARIFTGGANLSNTSYSSIDVRSIATSQWSLSIWAKPTVAAPAASKSLFQIGYATTDANNTYGFLHTSQKYYGALRTTADAGQNAAGTTNASTNWTNYILTGNSDSTVTLYVDGTSQATSAVASQVGGSATSKIRIGVTSFYDAWEGTIAHFAVYNKTLSAQDIADLQTYYPKGSNSLGPSLANLVNYWAFTSSSLTDSISSVVLTNNSTTQDSATPTLSDYTSGASAAITGRNLLLGVG